MGYQPNINCTKIDRKGCCQHLDVPNSRFLLVTFRPNCKLLSLREIIDKEGNVTYDDKCKYQEKFTRPLM